MSSPTLLVPGDAVPATASAADALAELTAAHRLSQLTVLEDLVVTLSSATTVTHLLVRGSLADGTADRLSDVDLVVAVRDDQVPAVIAALDLLMSNRFGALLPGWRDTIVGPLGGAGSVYLLPHGGHLLQLDLYLCPTSTVGALRRRTGARLLWQGEDTQTGAGPAGQETAARALEQLAGEPSDCGTLLVQAVVLHAMLRKRLARGQRYIAYDLYHQLHATCAALMRTALVPQSRHHGWYHLDDEIGRTAAGRECLRELEEALSGPAVPALAQADQALEQVMRVAELAAPAAVADLADELAAYRAYQQQEVTR